MSDDREPPRRPGPGRPPLDDADRDSVGVYVRIPSRQYDAVWQRAQRERVTVPELIRQFISSKGR